MTVTFTTPVVRDIAAIPGSGFGEQIRRTADKLGIFNRHGSGYRARFTPDEALTIAVARALVAPNPKQSSYERYETEARAVVGLWRSGVRPDWLVIIGDDYSVWSDTDAESLAAHLLAHDGVARVLRLTPIIERLEKAIAEAP